MDERFECCRYEPSLEDLLADEVMTPVLRSAGLEAKEFREMMVETARRIEDRDRRSGQRVDCREPGSRREPGNSSRTRSPGRLSPSTTAPPCRRATARTRLSPSPLPGVLRLGSRRTKRSNTLSRSASGMPGPRSATSSTARSSWSKTADRDLAATGIFEGVVEQIGDRLRQQVPVAADFHARLRRRAVRANPFSSATGS